MRNEELETTLPYTSVTSSRATQTRNRKRQATIAAHRLRGLAGLSPIDAVTAEGTDQINASAVTAHAACANHSASHITAHAADN